MLAYAKLNEDVLVLVEGFEAVLERMEGCGCMRLELGVVDEVEEGMRNCEYFKLAAPVRRPKKTLAIPLCSIPVHCKIDEIPFLKWQRPG